MWGFEGALGALGLGGAHHAAVPFGVGVLLGHEEVGGAGADACDPGFLVDALGEKVGGRCDEKVGHGGAVPVAFDELGAAELGLGTELVLGVVVDGLVTHGADGELEVLGLLVVVEAVACEKAARIAGVDVLEGFEGDLCGAVAGLVDGEGEDQGGYDVGVGGTVGQGRAVVVRR